MRAALSFIEQPILFAASRAMSWVYRKFGISPVRQVPGWEMLVALIEMTVVTCVIAMLYRSGERTLVYILPMMIISMAGEAFLNHRKFTSLSNRYDAKVYREALAEAKEHQTGGIFLRAVSVALPLIGLVMFSATLPPAYVWIGWIVALYFGLYASKFYVRACEPPRPNDGDYFAMPQAGRA